MKKTILILLLLMSTVAFTQEIKKCVEVKVEKLDAYRVKVTKTNNCVEPKEITVQAYLRNEWIKKQKKRKKRKND
tara:strand:+ start:937 stop:1161 length:225 start_codon:yes stop_codon:yes gene_type:complete